jgi:hypothetical protein
MPQDAIAPAFPLGTGFGVVILLVVVMLAVLGVALWRYSRKRK